MRTPIHISPPNCSHGPSTHSLMDTGTAMRRTLLLASLLMIILPLSGLAQQGNASVGGGVAFPLASSSRFVNPSGHFVLGAGVNIKSRFGVTSEFLWQKLPVKQEVLNGSGILDANAIQMALTLNGIVRFPLGKRLGGYTIGGAGWYIRTGSLRFSGAGPTPEVICGPFLAWWGLNCISAQFPEQKSSDAFGGNVGVGLTTHLGEGGMKFFTEIRFHYAPHWGVNTDTLLVTSGLRW